MIKEISIAILDRYSSSPDAASLRSDLSGGLWFMEAPQATSEPYAVFTWDGSTVDEIFGDRFNRIETASITVSIYSKNDDGGVEVFGIAQKFMELFDWAELTYPAGNYEHIAIKRNSIVNRGKLDKIWLLELDYDIIYEH